MTSAKVGSPVAVGQRLGACVLGVGLGFRPWGLGFQDAWFRELRVDDLGFRARFLGLGVQGAGVFLNMVHF